jgi:hypothetical protein
MQHVANQMHKTLDVLHKAINSLPQQAMQCIAADEAPLKHVDAMES